IFFFQAEDGIRDRNVTGVQTCALPILLDEAGRVESVIKIATDVTEQEKTIKDSTDEFMGLVEEMTAHTNEVHNAFQEIVSETKRLKNESDTMEDRKSVV